MSIPYSPKTLCLLRLLFFPHWLLWIFIGISVLNAFIQIIHHKKHSLLFPFCVGYLELLVWQTCITKVPNLLLVVQMAGLRMNGRLLPCIVLSAMLVCIILNTKDTLYYLWHSQHSISSLHELNSIIRFCEYLILTALFIFRSSEQGFLSFFRSLVFLLLWSTAFDNRFWKSNGNLFFFWLMGLLPFLLQGIPVDCKFDDSIWFAVFTGVGFVWTLIIFWIAADKYSPMADGRYSLRLAGSIGVYCGGCFGLYILFSLFVSMGFSWFSNAAFLSLTQSKALITDLNLLFNMIILDLFLSGIAAGLLSMIHINQKEYRLNLENPQKH